MRVTLKQEVLVDFLARSTISQNHWAIKLGISRGHWSELVNGKHPYPSPKTRKLLVEILGIPFDELFEVSTEPLDGADFKAAIADRYMIDREIGQGGMGIVYLARDLKHSRQVAIKSVFAEAVSGIGAEQFLKEIRRTASLQHPNILPLHDSGEAAGQPFYVVPYIEEGSLRDLMQRERRIPVDRVIRIMRGVAAALQHAHEHRVVHCDIKPENILMAGDHAYVADFGISRALHSEFFEWSDRPSLDGSAGTPAYVSPEQASGERVLDARSDVYSLGCVVFEMLSGEPPFTGTKTMEIVSKRFTDDTPDLAVVAPGVSSGVARAVTRATELLGQRRQATPPEFLADLEAGASERDTAWSNLRRSVYENLRFLALRVLGLGSTTRGGRFVFNTLTDVRQAARTLFKRPGFAAVTILTLALGIGMNSAIFSILYGVMIRPLPFANPDELVQIGRIRPEIPTVLLPISAANFVDLEERSRGVADLEAAVTNSFMMTTAEGATSPQAVQEVSPGYFDILGLPPALGRGFRPDDAIPGAPRVVVIDHRTWETDFAGDSTVVGSTIMLDEEPFAVVGVAHPDARLGSERLWAPFQWGSDDLDSRGSNFLRIYARLNPGVEIAAATEQLLRIWTELGAEYPDSYDDSEMRAEALSSTRVGRSTTTIYLLTGAVALVLLIACVNVANLTLARTEARTREIAVRAALGASRYRVVRLFVTESMMVALAGGAVGVLAAYFGVDAILTAFASSVPRSDEIAVNGYVLSFALAVSLLTGLAVGSIPALITRPDHAALKEGGRGSAPRVTHLRKALVVAEVSMSLMLATGAGLLVRSFWQASQSDPGFDHRNLLVANLWLPPSRYGGAAQVIEYHDELTSRLRALPDVENLGMINMIPMRRFGSNVTVLRALDNDELSASFVEVRSASPGYFQTMRMPLLQGRFFTDQDYGPDGEREAVTIINQELARILFPDRDPIGRRLRRAGRDGLEIVGVVGSVKSFGSDREVPPAFYQPTPVASNIVIRTTGNPDDLAPQLRAIAADIDPSVSVYRTENMEDIRARSLGSRRFQLTLLVLFASVAVALGAIGIYGVMSYSVEQRTREMGVRLALGQNPASLLKLVVTQGTKVALVGIAIGAVGSLLLKSLIESFLYQVNSWDPLTYIGSAVLLALVAVMSCYLPARRASKVDPIEALRWE